MIIPRPIALFIFAIPWIIAGLFAMWLAILRFPPSGVFQVTTILNGDSAWIFPFLPAERVSKPGIQADGWTGQRIVNDPAYFTARVPGPYESVDVSLEFRPLRQPLIELGMIHDAAGTALEMRPLYASELESSEWIAATSNERHGYVHSGVPMTRLADPDTRGLSVWGASSTSPRMQDPPGVVRSTPVSLRGSHDFYVVPTNVMSMAFTLQPVNRKPGNDIVSFRVFYGDEEVQREAFDVSGSRETRMGQTLSHTIEIPFARPGVYRISFTADDDVFVRKIETPSRRWVVGPRLVFGDVVGYATTTMPGLVWTNSRHLVAETFHVEGLQTIRIGTQQMALSKTHVTMRMDRVDALEGPVELNAPQGDVRFIGDGFFAFTPDAFFEPSPRRFTSGTDLKKEHIDAVITPYQRPEAGADGWYHSRTTFTLDPTLDRLRFVVSAPGVLARSAAVDIRRITLTYHRKAGTLSDWLNIVHQEIVNAWRRL